ncbi:hypothetical protein BGAL_0483g00020 [Botrytis galanthina]|uniref:Uncharacterized protein n=1 Tax=Botrytis galanthina TaxID=278940 RepID=A0A4S8QVC9_9HELO|nr:hypothetical protein BGAL_0483g00020 [Botrytis galanthina]
MITPRASLPTVLAGSPNLQARQSRIVFSTCGFVDGNANQPFIAPTGSICRVDTAEGIWGVCTTSVIDLSPADCGWVGSSSASPFCQITTSSGAGGALFTSLNCGSQPVRETVFITASTTGPIPASPHLASSLPASSTEKASSAVQATSDSSSQSNPDSVAASASASGSSPNTVSKSPGSSSGSSGSSESQPSDAASLSGSSPGQSVFTVSGSLVTSFFGQTNTVGVTVLVTTTASGISSPSPSDSTAPTPKNPPKYDPKALIGIVLGVIVFLLLLIFTLIWIGKYRRAQRSKSTTPTAESPTNFFFSNLPEVMEPFAKTDGIHEMYDDHGELRELDIAGAVAGRTGRVSVRELAATPVVGARRSGRRSAREMEGDIVWRRERISIKELDGGVFERNGRRGDSVTQVFELDGQSYI